MQRPIVVDAAAQGNVDVVRRLCELPQGEPGAVTQWVKDTALVLAAQNGHSTVVRYLCKQPQGHPEAVSPWAVHRALLSATSKGNSTAVRYLCELPLNRGVDPSRSNNEAIESAARGGHVDVVRYLCELPGDRGVNPGADDNDAIQRAAAHNQLHVVRYLCAALPPHPQCIVQCVSQACQRCGSTAQYCRYDCHAHWTLQSVFSKFYTPFARMSARRSLVLLYALVRGRRCGYKPGQSGNGYGVTWREKGGSDGRLSTE